MTVTVSLSEFRCSNACDIAKAAWSTRDIRVRGEVRDRRHRLRCQDRPEKIFEFGPGRTRIARKRAGRFNRLNIVFRSSARHSLCIFVARGRLHRGLIAHLRVTRGLIASATRIRARFALRTFALGRSGLHRVYVLYASFEIDVPPILLRDLCQRLKGTVVCNCSRKNGSV